jgi:hypothetical protein
MSSHLKFNEVPSKSGKTKVTEIISNHDESLLGIVKWNSGWRTYCFYPNLQYETMWSWDCLIELNNYINNLNMIQKLKPKDI